MGWYKKTLSFLTEFENIKFFDLSDTQCKKKKLLADYHGIALTKLDVLDELDEIKICIQYDLDGKKIDYLPAAVEDQLKIKPIFKTFPGWKSSTKGIKNINDLPDNAKKYIFALEDFCWHQGIKRFN